LEEPSVFTFGAEEMTEALYISTILHIQEDHNLNIHQQGKLSLNFMNLILLPLTVPAWWQC
jgi:hypothetical protein